MPLNALEKITIADLFDEENHYFWGMSKAFYIKEIYLKAYMLLWKQNNKYAIRHSIAKHFAEEMMNQLQLSDSNLYPNIKDFFIKSILSSKIKNDFYQRILLQGKFSKNNAIKTINIDYEKELKSQLNIIFQESQQQKHDVEKIFLANMKSLKTWVKGYPYEFFNKEKEESFNYQINIGNYISIIIPVLAIAIGFSQYDDNAVNATIWAIVLHVLFSHLYPNLIIALNLSSYYNTIKSTVHLDVTNIDEDDDVTQLDRTTNLSRNQTTYNPALSLVISEKKPIVWSNNYEGRIEESTPTENKAPKRKNITSAANSDGKENTDVASVNSPAIPKVLPDFFGFVELQPEHIVVIDQKNLGRNMRYFGIWNKSSIAKDISDSNDWKIHDSLFEIFKTGDTARKEGDAGIKFLTNLRLFEVKKPKTTARVYGDQTIQKGDKKALVFAHYSNTGFHKK